MNLLEKNRLRKNIKEIKKNNEQVKEFMDIIKEQLSELTPEHIETIENIKKHMDNLNVIFNEMNQGIKNKK